MNTQVAVPPRPRARLVRVTGPPPSAGQSGGLMSAIGDGERTQVVRKQFLELNLYPGSEKAFAATLAERAVRSNYMHIIINI